MTDLYNYLNQSTTAGLVQLSTSIMDWLYGKVSSSMHSEERLEGIDGH